MNPLRRLTTFFLLLPLGAAWSDPAGPAEIVQQLETLCMGADQMLFRAFPGQYVSCSLNASGRACESLYIPGQGAVIRFRVAFPLVRAASVPEDTAASTPEAEVSSVGTAATPQQSYSQFQVQMQQLRQNSLHNTISVTQISYQHGSNQCYDASRCELLLDHLARVLSNYAALLAVIPATETISVVIEGPADMTRRASAGHGIAAPTRARYETIGIRPPAFVNMGSTRVVPLGVEPTVPGRSTLTATLVRSQVSEDPAKTRQAMKVASY